MEQENGWQKFFHDKWCFRGHSTVKEGKVDTNKSKKPTNKICFHRSNKYTNGSHG